jgi:hypothetical protein
MHLDVPHPSHSLYILGRMALKLLIFGTHTSPQEGGEHTEFATLIEFWKMDLGAFTGRGQGGPCLTDAAQ